METNIAQDPTMVQTPIPQKNTFRTVLIVIAFLLLIVSLLAYVFYFYPKIQEQKGNNQAGTKYDLYYKTIALTDNAYYQRLIGKEPKIMQASAVNDIKQGINTPLTQSNIYFIAHRYFDTNGNIYEIYDYIKANPELSFLHNEAQEIYPEVFKDLEDRKLPNYFNDESTYVFLAYIEILYKYGYANGAALATAANQYAGNTYFRTVRVNEMTATPQQERDVLLKNNQRDIGKAKLILSYADNEIKAILENTVSPEILPRDRLVAVNQYAATLRYLEALGSPTTSSKTATELFAFSMAYSRDAVPELYYFTSLLNASTLVILEQSSSEEVRVALLPIIQFDPKQETTYKGGVFNRVLSSRSQALPSQAGTRRTDIYSRWNTVKLAEKVPEFRDWLMKNGWTETDFDIYRLGNQ